VVARPPAEHPSLASVSIKRFKCIESLDLSFDDKPLVLVGANNSGKSSALHALHFAVSVAQTAKLVGEGVNWSWDKFKLSFNPAQLIWSPVADVMSLAFGGDLYEYQPSQIEIAFTDSRGNRGIVAVRRGRNRNISVVLTGRTLCSRLQNIEAPFSVYTPGLAGIAREEKYLSPGVVRRSVARGDANLVLRNVLHMLRRDTDKWLQFIEDIRCLFPDIRFYIQFNPNTDENIGTKIQLDDGPVLPLDAAGTAVLQAAQILGYLALYSPPLIILDEPDSHLHPNNQRSLCQLLTRLSEERHFRVIMSTHSRHVLDALRHSSKIVWLGKGATIENTDASLATRLLDMGALDSVDYLADDQLKCAVITEDTDTRPLRALLESSGFVLDDTHVSSYNGCARVDSAVVLGQFLNEHTNNVTVVVHRDRDYLQETDAATYRQAIEGNGLKCFLTERNEIESYFLNADHLAELNPTISIARIQEIITAVIQETRDDSVAAITNSRHEDALRLRRQEGGPPPNVGDIANQARADFDDDPTAYARAKIVLPRVASRLQTEMGANPVIYEPSVYLLSPALSALAHEIWPEQQGED